MRMRNAPEISPAAILWALKYGKLTLEKKLIYHVIVPVCKKLGIYQLAAKIYLKK